MLNSEITYSNQLCTALFGNEGTKSVPLPVPGCSPLQSPSFFCWGFCPRGSSALVKALARVGWDDGRGGGGLWRLAMGVREVVWIQAYCKEKVWWHLIVQHLDLCVGTSVGVPTAAFCVVRQQACGSTKCRAQAWFLPCFLPFSPWLQPNVFKPWLLHAEGEVGISLPLPRCWLLHLVCKSHSIHAGRKRMSNGAREVLPLADLWSFPCVRAKFFPWAKFLNQWLD